MVWELSEAVVFITPVGYYQVTLRPEAGSVGLVVIDSLFPVQKLHFQFVVDRKEESLELFISLIACLATPRNRSIGSNQVIELGLDDGEGTADSITIAVKVLGKEVML